MKKCLTWLVMFLATLSAAEMTLAENGAAKASIVIPANGKPIVKFAASELAAYLKRMTGADFPVVTSPRGEVNFYLGFGDAEEFVNDEFVIDAAGKRIDIYGKDTTGKVDLFNYFYDNPDKGTLRGVYNFLDSLGVRWLAPGEENTYIPHRRTLRISEQRIRYRPFFQDRQIADAWNFMKYPDSKAYVQNANELFLWGIRNNVSTRGMVAGCHSERSLKLFENPDWLAHPTAHQLMKNGKRNPHYSCWTDPFTKKIWMRAADGYFSGKTPRECGFNIDGYIHSQWPMPFIARDEFMIDPMDHGGGSDGRCRCDRCREFRKKYPCADDTEIIWQVIGDIAKQIEKKYPNCYISTLVYPPKRLIPQTIQKPKNIRLRICMPGARLLLYPDKLTRDMKLLQDWGDFLGAKNIPLWIYQCDASFGHYLPGVPDLYPHLTAKFIRMVKPHCAGMFCENHNMTHTYRNLDVYIFMRLMWKPERDVEKELDEYFRLYYGPAAIPAKKLFTRLEDNWLKIDPLIFADSKNQAALGAVRKDSEEARKKVWSEVYHIPEMKKIDGLMQEILRSSPAGTVYAKRAELLRKYLIQVMKDERGEVMEKEELRKSLKLSVLSSAAKDFPTTAEWSHAPEYRLLSARRLFPELQAGGSFRILASKDMLFLRADLKEPRMTETKTDPARRSGDHEIWRDNCIELFFYAEKSKKFWQIIVNDNGAWSSQTRGRILPRWVQLTGLRVETRRRADGWTADIAVPIRELHTDKSDLRFNLCRERNTRGGGTEYSTWSPLATLGSWHLPENYGIVVFE